jgi:arylsulfatase A-like enzyme
MQAPDYIPATIVTNKGDGEFSDNPYYHSNIAVFSLLCDFLKHLQANGIYDNTRIIVVSDHGGSVLTDRSDFILPTGEYRQSYSALLMVKDFNERHDFTNDYTFMTNADVSLLTTKDLIPNAANPFTGKLLESKKSGKLAIATIPAFITHPGNKYQVADNEWLYVHDDVFKPENWETVKR